MPRRLSGGTRLKVLESMAMPKGNGLDLGRLRGSGRLALGSRAHRQRSLRLRQSPPGGNPSADEKSQLRSDMSVAARHIANQKIYAFRNHPQILADCKDAG